MDADHDQAAILVLLGPGADVGEGAQPVDAGVRPEVDEHDLPAQILRSERRRIEPAGRPVETGHVALRRQGSVAAQAEQAHFTAPTSRTASANASGASCGRLCPTPPSMVRCEYGPENFAAYAGRIRMWCAVCVALERDRGHGDDGAFGEPLLQFCVPSFAVSQPESPAVVVNRDGDVIRVVEGRCAALEGRVVEVPPRRRGPPDELRKFPPVLVVSGPAALGGEVVLVPPLQLGLRGQRQLAGCLAADQVAAHGDETGDRSGQSAATTSAVRAPQSNPATIAQSISSASRRAIASTASAACSPLRTVSSERKRVLP